MINMFLIYILVKMRIENYLFYKNENSQIQYLFIEIDTRTEHEHTRTPYHTTVLLY